jgi:hypothetical protein
MMKQLFLYSTSHCHLCESAQALLANHNHIFTLNIIDIAENETLLAQYGSRIPVLVSVDNASELNWPFDEIKLKEFLANLISNKKASL